MPALSQGKMLSESSVIPRPMACFSEPMTKDTSSSYLICTLERLTLTLSAKLLILWEINPGGSVLGAAAASEDSEKRKSDG